MALSKEREAAYKHHQEVYTIKKKLDELGQQAYEDGFGGVSGAYADAIDATYAISREIDRALTIIAREERGINGRESV